MCAIKSALTFTFQASACARLQYLWDAHRRHVRLVVENATKVLAVREDFVLTRKEGAAGVDQVHTRELGAAGELEREQEVRRKWKWALVVVCSPLGLGPILSENYVHSEIVLGLNIYRVIEFLNHILLELPLHQIL